MNYCESISKPSDTRYVHKKQSGGAGQFADVAIKFEPGEAGSGFEFRSEIKGGVVPKEYIPGVIKGIEECMESGILAGYPMVDIKATLYDGSFHEVDSSVMAFQMAARGAFRNGVAKAKPRLLEPLMKVLFLSASGTFAYCSILVFFGLSVVLFFHILLYCDCWLCGGFHSLIVNLIF